MFDQWCQEGRLLIGEHNCTLLMFDMFVLQQAIAGRGISIGRGATLMKAMEPQRAEQQSGGSSAQRPAVPVRLGMYSCCYHLKSFL